MSTDGLDRTARVAQAGGRAGARRALHPLPLAGLAGACAVALVALYVLLLRTTSGQRLDQNTLDRRALATRPARYAVHDLLTTISVGMLVLVLGVLIGQAIVRRRLPLALVAGAIVGGAALCTELLKHVLFRPYLFPGEPLGNTFPSGHTTVAFSVGIAATLLAPPRLRNAVAGGAVVYGTAVGIAVVAAAWHRPSDVVGAFLVVTGWSAVVALFSAIWFPGIFSGEASARRSPITPRDVLLGGLALAGGYAVALIAVIARDGGTIDWTLPGGTFIAACAAIAVAAALLTTALLVALRRSLRA
jgi:PAP2 superfamily